MGFKSKSSEGNQWLKDRQGFEEDLLAAADDASIVYESALELLKSIQNFWKGVGEDERKHPYGKASKAVKVYSVGMKAPTNAFARAAEQFDKFYGTCEALKEHIGSTVLAKLMSFKDIECKELDQNMSMLKKAHADYYKKKKGNAEPVVLEAAETSYKKLVEDAKERLAKFNKAGFELMTQMSADMKTGFDTYCESGSA